MASFESLPPDLILKVIRMAMGDVTSSVTVGDGTLMSPICKLPVTRQHNFLVDVIAKVSTRFEALATSKELWRGEVGFRGAIQ